MGSRRRSQPTGSGRPGVADRPSGFTREELPGAIEEITPAWLSHALSLRYPGTEVREVEVESSLHGSATKLALRVTYESPTDLPTFFYLKGGFEEHGHAVGSGYVNEARFYEKWAPRLPPIERPRCYFAAADREKRQGILLLEDLGLRGCTFNRAFSPLSVDRARGMLRVLAAIHGASWGRTEGLTVVNPPNQHTARFFRAMLEKFLPAGLAHPEIGERVQGPLRDPRFFSRKIVELWSVHSPVMCAVHGDAHIGNTYLTAAGEAGLLDFQTFGAGSWAREFTYFTVGSISVEDRRASLDALLDHYLAELGRHGGTPPERHEVMQSVRRNLVHGLFSWVACPLDLQPLEIVKRGADRMAIACDELDAVAAFDAEELAR